MNSAEALTPVLAGNHAGKAMSPAFVITPILTVLLGLAVAFSSATPTFADEDDLPSLSLLRQQTRDLLKLQATLPDGDEKDDATVALCDLYVVLRNDPRYAGSEMLRGDATKIRRRLLGVAKSLERELRRKGTKRPSGLSGKVDSAIQAALDGDDPDLGGAAAGGMFDNGWQLVELIQRIIAPDFWEPRGGPGSMRYFAMRRVLVVRATSDVHEQIKDLLNALR